MGQISLLKAYPETLISVIESHKGAGNCLRLKSKTYILMTVFIIIFLIGDHVLEHSQQKTEGTFSQTLPKSGLHRQTLFVLGTKIKFPSLLHLSRRGKPVKGNQPQPPRGSPPQGGHMFVCYIFNVQLTVEITCMLILGQEHKDCNLLSQQLTLSLNQPSLSQSLN